MNFREFLEKDKRPNINKYFEEENIIDNTNKESDIYQEPENDEYDENIEIEQDNIEQGNYMQYKEKQNYISNRNSSMQIADELIDEIKDKIDTIFYKFGIVGLEKLNNNIDEFSDMLLNPIPKQTSYGEINEMRRIQPKKYIIKQKTNHNISQTEYQNDMIMNANEILDNSSDSNNKIYQNMIGTNNKDYINKDIVFDVPNINKQPSYIPMPEIPKESQNTNIEKQIEQIKQQIPITNTEIEKQIIQQTFNNETDITEQITPNKTKRTRKKKTEE